MRHIIRFGIVAVFAVAGVLLIAGCGGDDDKGTGPSTLSAEAQFDSLSSHFDFEPGSGNDDIVSTMLAQLNTQYWDGIDESDFEFAVGAMPHTKLFPHATPAAVTDTTFSFSYDPVGGWWYIEYHESWLLFGASYDAVFTDSVRFETEAGNAQMVPDETTTYRIVQHETIEITLLTSNDGSSLGVATDFQIDVAGLNATTVTINSDGSLGLDVGIAEDQSSFAMSVGMMANWDDVTAANPGTSDVCPQSGSITGGFTLDLDVQDGINHYQANGDWDVGILFTGGGNTTVNVQSGDFQRSFTGNVCTK